MNAKRDSFIQEAEERMALEILEGPEHAFFAGVPVLRADEGDIEAAAKRALAEVGLCLVCEVSGGPVPVCPGDIVPWNASVAITEIPALNRAGTGKTADMALEALLRTYATEGRPEAVFAAQEVEPFRERIDGKQFVGYAVRGEVHVVPLSGDAPGTPPPPDGGSGPTAQDLEELA
jgi:hypothetical protein